jgi:hypothetical protein
MLDGLFQPRYLGADPVKTTLDIVQTVTVRGVSLAGLLDLGLDLAQTRNGRLEIRLPLIDTTALTGFLRLKIGQPEGERSALSVRSLSFSFL